MQVVATFDKPPAGVAILPDGRVIMSFSPLGGPDFSVVEVLPGGGTRPYPTERWSSQPQDDGVGVAGVIGLRAEANGILWMLDIGSPTVVPKLVGWDTRRNLLARVIYLPTPVTAPNSFHQDLAVDPRHEAIYIADMGRADFCGPSQPAIVVVDLKTGFSRRVLEGHPSLRPEDVPMVVGGKPVSPVGAGGDRCAPRFGLNPITIDTHHEWVYFGPVSGTSLYRIRAADLSQASLSAHELAQRVERFGDKPVSDGITIDEAGNVYVSDLENDAVGVVDPQGNYRILHQDHDLLKWPDGFSYGPDGYCYLTVSQLHRMPVLNDGKDESRPPFHLVRFRPLAPSAIRR
jgi:sugar lactone lactonase YvrE